MAGQAMSEGLRTKAQTGADPIKKGLRRSSCWELRAAPASAEHREGLPRAAAPSSACPAGHFSKGDSIPGSTGLGTGLGMRLPSLGHRGSTLNDLWISSALTNQE